MTIKWDSQAAEDAIRRMRASDASLNDCLHKADKAREDLERAVPDSSDTMRKLLSQYDAAVRSMRANEQALSELIASAEAVKRGFEDAESVMKGKVDALAVRAESDTPPARRTPQWRVIRSDVTPLQPKPFIMPVRRTDLFTPAWLDMLLNDKEIIATILSNRK